MNKLTRRKLLASAAALGAGVHALPAAFATQTQLPYLFIHIFANGGWDVASFCDPKINLDKKINTWAESSGPQKAGDISYAPVANNADLFSRHFDKMLVINGLNAQTNVHSAGRLKSLTGHTKSGYPSIGTLHAANLGANLPMPLLVGNSFETGGLLATTQINNGLVNIVNSSQLTGARSLSSAQLQLIENDIQKSLALAAPTAATKHYHAATQTRSDSYLSKTAETYRALSQGDLPNHPVVNDMKFALAAFAAGASLSCDYSVTGFDTHGNHDSSMLAPLTNVNLAAIAAWHFAEQLNIADRLVVLMSSDFARTPFYNDVSGKDHWPFHSAIVMKKGAPWGNKVIGATDEKLVGQPLNRTTLQPDPYGILLGAHHLHQALRQFLSAAPSLTKTYPLEYGLEHNFLMP